MGRTGALARGNFRLRQQQVGGAGRRASVVSEQAASVVRQFVRGSRLAEQASAGCCQLLRIMDLPRPTGIQQAGDKVGKIFHVRSEQHRLAGRDGLSGILPANRREALADEHERGRRVPVAQLARGVEQEDVGPPVRRRDLSTTKDAQTK